MTYKLCLEHFTDSKDIEKEIGHYNDYYLTAIRTLKNSDNNLNKSNSDEAVDFTQKTLEHYELMFQHIYSGKDGLFVNYLLSQPVN